MTTTNTENGFVVYLKLPMDPVLCSVGQDIEINCVF